MDNYKENHMKSPIIINIYSERHHKPHGITTFETEENDDAHSGKISNAILYF